LSILQDADDDFEPTIYTARQTVIKMKIPKELVGVLIGRQGANMKLLEQESGARAHFDRCEGNPKPVILGYLQENLGTNLEF